MRRLIVSLVCLFVVTSSVRAELEVHTFDRQALTEDYFSEGAGFGDLNQDGKPDVVHGPFWWEGPDFTVRHEIYEPKPQNRRGYSDNFFSWVHDFNGDGWNDVLTAGLPGTPGFIFQNPGRDKFDQHWTRHKIFDSVGNESPQFVNLVGDEAPELVCARDGVFGYLKFDPKSPFVEQPFHIISGKITDTPFGHGLGVGDVNSDGRQDVLFKDGWLEQPASIDGEPLWIFHKYPFAGAGGGDMFAYDVDGDGDNDVITSLQAHAFGLAWYEQVKDGDQIDFKKHLIMGEKPEDSPYGLLFTELHTVALHDMDGDGLKDIVTGKTYWSHHDRSPMWDAGAVVYWFKLERGRSGIDWVPYLADGEAGVGRQLSVGDLNGDKLPDIVVGGMKGCHVLRQSVAKATVSEWKAARPKRTVPMAEGLSPQEAAERMTVPDGFQVQLAAGEPLVHQPVAFTIDHRGRLWIAEAYTYPNRAQDGEGKDKIIILEDTDGDGRFESRKVFIEGLNLVSGLEVGFGGVWVGAAPYLMFIPDRDGDDVPDKPTKQAAQDVKFPKDVPAGATVLLDGFGWQDTHETLNSFIWGPDGWLYGCHGVFTHSKVGKPGTPEELRQGLNAGVWRYHPVKHEFEVFSHGTSNPWGVDFNDRGQAFITACVIPHLWHMVQGGRYHRQGGQHFNPYTFDDIKTIADHAHYVGNLADHAWWGHEPHAPADTLAAGGGHAHCGAMIYLGDNWPEEYRNQIFMHNVHGNRINECLLVRSGSGYIGKRAPDTMIANDRWFRGINLKYGPDGSVYLIDWYDKNACHRTNPEIWDRTNGRVYNISYQGDGGKARPDHRASLAKLTSGKNSDLIELLDHPNEWYMRMARRRLQEQTVAPGGIPAKDAKPLRSEANVLKAKFKQAQTVSQKLRLLWTIHSVFGISPELTTELLEATGAEGEYLRAWAIQLELEDRTASPETLSKLQALALSDPSPVVRLYLASALQRLALADRWALAQGLLTHPEDAEDHNLPLVIWYGIEPLVKADSARAIGLAKSSKLEKVSRLIIRRAASTDDTLNAAIAWLSESSTPETQTKLLDEISKAFEGRVNIRQPGAWTVAYDVLLKSNDPTVHEKADQLAVAFGDQRILPRMRKTLTDSSASIAQRRKALDLIVKGRDAEASAALVAALEEKELRSPAIKALAAYDDAKIPAAILSLYSHLNDGEKRDAINTLVSRPLSAGKLFDAIEKGGIPRTDVHAYHVQQLLGFKDAELSKRIKSTWGDIRPTAAEKVALIAKHKASLTPAVLKSADLSNGRRLFAKTCAACHVLFGEGGKIGPDITGSNRANLDYILENVLDPSAIVGKDYRMTVIATHDGRVISGLIQKETDSAVTLRTINDTVVVAKSDIDERKLSELSLMPEGQLNQLTADEQRDLIAYLGSPNQVAMRGPKAPIDPKTGRVPHAIEGESMKIVGKTKGNAASQPMGGFPKDKWSGSDQLWWTGASPGARLDLEFTVADDGIYDLEIVLTMARDYGIVRVSVDDEAIGEPIDCYDVDVVTTGVLSYGPRKLVAGNHKLGFEISGANPKADKGYMVGIDYVRLVPRTE